MDFLYVLGGLLALGSPWIFIAWLIGKVYD